MYVLSGTHSPLCLFSSIIPRPYTLSPPSPRLSLILPCVLLVYLRVSSGTHLNLRTVFLRSTQSPGCYWLSDLLVMSKPCNGVWATASGGRRYSAQVEAGTRRGFCFFFRFHKIFPFFIKFSLFQNFSLFNNFSLFQKFSLFIKFSLFMEFSLFIKISLFVKFSLFIDFAI